MDIPLSTLKEIRDEWRKPYRMLDDAPGTQALFSYIFQLSAPDPGYGAIAFVKRSRKLEKALRKLLLAIREYDGCVSQGAGTGPFFQKVERRLDNAIANAGRALDE